jgi:hypothetical protein
VAGVFDPDVGLPHRFLDGFEAPFCPFNSFQQKPQTGRVQGSARHDFVELSLRGDARWHRIFVPLGQSFRGQLHMPFVI